MGEADAVFCSLFRTDAEAAMLACDEAGLLPEELLYLPRPIFEMGATCEEQARIRYNMRERFRQEMFRKVFSLKKSILLGGPGSVAEKWEQRNRIFPDAAPIPDLSQLRKTVKGDGLTVEADDLDTESDDDGLDEFFRPKPKPAVRLDDARTVSSPAGPPSAFGSARFASTARPVGGSQQNVFSPLSDDGRLLKSSSSTRRQDKEPQPPPPPPIPHLPREPPRAKALTARSLEKEEKTLEVCRKRLARYGTQVDKVVALTQERSPQRSPSRPMTLALTATPGMESSTSSSLPRIASAQNEGKKQLSAMIRNTMVGIAQSAIEYNNYREDVEEDMEEDDYRLHDRSARMQQSIQSRELWNAQCEARRKRREEQRQAQLALVEAYEKFTADKTQRSEQVLQKRAQGHQLSNEVQRMRQLFAQEKRDCLNRIEEARVTKILAKSEPKHNHAAEFVYQRNFIAQQRKIQHVQLELLRRELKSSVQNMKTRNEWQVPEVLEQLIGSNPAFNFAVSDASGELPSIMDSQQ